MQALKLSSLFFTTSDIFSPSHVCVGVAVRDVLLSSLCMCALMSVLVLAGVHRCVQQYVVFFEYCSFFLGPSAIHIVRHPIVNMTSNKSIPPHLQKATHDSAKATQWRSRQRRGHAGTRPGQAEADTSRRCAGRACAASSDPPRIPLRPPPSAGISSSSTSTPLFYQKLNC